ncbi:hypothetical protein CCMA1212_001716 [Trichoderma ghanense]|uniref:Uncharacterized protein n=1 Tax=Trichoderma ghanense TaxID=65468 RepID=A0ABY2HDC5_9HYPO
MHDVNHPQVANAVCRRGLNGRSLPHSQSTLLRRASPAGQPRRADGALVRSFYPLETCDGVSTRRFWAWQGQHQGAKMVSDPPAAPPKRPALPASPTTCPQRHSGTAARVLWCSRPCPSESRPSRRGTEMEVEAFRRGAPSCCSLLPFCLPFCLPVKGWLIR